MIKMIDFVYENEVESFNDSYEEDFLKIIETTLDNLSIEDDIEMSCLLVDDQRIHEINREYRHIDRSTDVISFALEDSEQFYVEGMARNIGDIFISVDHAIAQAEEYGHSLRREMCFLFTHGLLHLLGYDHMNEEDEKEMFGKQKEILDILNIGRGI
ncbi:MAG: rRNA maturation RNase YbeY [Bacilli bacterium]|nr:rRNA maturation RNase YbeY [Bacilli bacterium]